MPEYFYTAKKIEGGEKQSGTLEAANKSDLAKALRQEGLVLIKAFIEEEKKKKNLEISIPFLEGVRLKDKVFFTRNLQVMVSAGLSLPKALKILSDQTENKKFKKTLENIRMAITQGSSFSDALSHHQDVFSELFQNMIKVGEESGTMENVLKTLTEQMEREADLKSKIKGALIYPAVIISAMLGIGVLMLVMVVPQLSQTFEELEIELPPTTRAVMFLGNFLLEKWYFLILIIAVLVFFIKFISKTKTGKRIIDRLLLKIPIISQIIKQTNSAYTTRTLGSLINSGVPIVRSLEIVSNTLGNIYFREAMANSAEKVRKGEKFSEALKPYDKIYPILVIQMIEVGEETGETSGILSKLADFFESEVTNATKNLSSIIEPILMLIIGGVVGFFAISMVQPMYSMLGAIE